MFIEVVTASRKEHVLPMVPAKSNHEMHVNSQTSKTAQVSSFLELLFTILSRRQVNIESTSL